MWPWSLLLFFSTPVYGLYGNVSGKLLLTGGISSVEGQAGGGITPWAFIGGYGTRDQVGANIHYSKIRLPEYEVETQGILFGIKDRIEISYGRQSLNTLDHGVNLGLGRGFKVDLDVIGLKVKIHGDGVLDQGSLVPQIAIGIQKKEVKNEEIESFGADDLSGMDMYFSASKLILKYGFLYNITFRYTNANQIGFLGFGGDENSDKTLHYEGSLGYLVNRKLVLGVEYRDKPNNLAVSDEEPWFDFFLAYAGNKNVSLSVAYVNLGEIALQKKQEGVFTSLQIGF